MKSASDLNEQMSNCCTQFRWRAFKLKGHLTNPLPWRINLIYRDRRQKGPTCFCTFERYSIYIILTRCKIFPNLPVNTAKIALKCSFHQQRYSALKAQCVNPAGSLAVIKNISSVINDHEYPHLVLVETICWYHVSAKCSLGFVIFTRNTGNCASI